MVPTSPETAARERELNSLYIFTVVILLVVVTATFGALIWAFVWRSENSYLWGHLYLPPLLWGTTAILLASSVTLERARACMRANDEAGLLRFARWTTAFGSLFLVGQGVAWLQVVHSKVVLDSNKHSWFIFLFSGLHALHIVAGLAGLAYLLYRVHQHASGPRYRMTTHAYINALALFWHYLAFVWVVLFALLLTWRR